jgi:hypothetical protein
MENQAHLGGVFTMPRTSLTLNRIGYGAMQLPDLKCGVRPKIDMHATILEFKHPYTATMPPSTGRSMPVT